MTKEIIFNPFVKNTQQGGIRKSTKSKKATKFKQGLVINTCTEPPSYLSDQDTATEHNDCACNYDYDRVLQFEQSGSPLASVP